MKTTGNADRRYGAPALGGGGHTPAGGWGAGGRGRRPGQRLVVGGILGAMAAAVLAAATLGVAQDQPAAPLRPEYSRVVQVSGFMRPVRMGDALRWVFRTQNGDWSAVVLENQILSALEERKDVAEGRVMVAVTGMVTEYRGRNCLLLTAAEVRPAPPSG